MMIHVPNTCELGNCNDDDDDEDKPSQGSQRQGAVSQLCPSEPPQVGTMCAPHVAPNDYHDDHGEDDHDDDDDDGEDGDDDVIADSNQSRPTTNIDIYTFLHTTLEYRWKFVDLQIQIRGALKIHFRKKLGI